MLTDSADRFFKKVEFDPSGDGAARKIHPAGSASPVVIDPRVRFGKPSVDGVSTERLWELFDAGETVDEVSSGYELASDKVSAAIANEEQLGILAA